MNFLSTILWFLTALGILVFFHEFGHYTAARLCGVKVLKFSVGFGPSILRWTMGKDKTEWALAALPLGGYVRMLDENDVQSGAQTSISPEDLPRAFSRQTVGKRMFIVVAGPVANLLLAIFFYAILNLAGISEPAARVGEPQTNSAAAKAGLKANDLVLEIDSHSVASWNAFRLRVLDAAIERRSAVLLVDRAGRKIEVTINTAGLPEGELEKDFTRTLGIELASGQVVIGSISASTGGSASGTESAAAKAGLRAGDTVLELDGKPIAKARDLIAMIRENKGTEQRWLVDRSGTRLTIIVVPVVTEEAATDKSPAVQVGKIGAALSQRLQMIIVDRGLFESIASGVNQTWDMSVFSLRMLGKMLIGQLSWRNLSGPVTIADYAGQTAKIGWYAYVNFLALISVSLAVLNLLPIPVLDGGHLVYYGLEAIRGRPMPKSFIENTQRVGMGLIGIMMVLALFNDLTRVFGS